MHSGGTRRNRVVAAAVVAGVLLLGAGCGGGGDDGEEAAATEVQLIDPGDTRPPQPTSSTTSTTTTTEAPTTTTTEAPTTTTTDAESLDDGEAPDDGEVPADIVDQANYVCGSRQYDAIAGGDQPDAVAAVLPVAEQVVAELRPLAEAAGGSFLDAVRSLDLAIAYAGQAAEADAAGDADTADARRPEAVDAFASAAESFTDLGMDQCATRPA